MPIAQIEHVPHQSSLQVQNLFNSPYCHQSPTEILQYFYTRNSVIYFPVIDPIETGRKKIENIIHHDFEFNGETQRLIPPIRWTHNLHQDREWLIFLHKFYYAVGLGMAFDDTQDLVYLKKWVELTDSWINLVPLNFLPSDVAGRRIQNWIFAHYFFVSKQRVPGLEPEFYIRFLSSLSQQVSYLCNHLAPSRNHRTLELGAIFLAGVVFPELRQASYWLEFAKTELVNNIQTDLLSDGVHCEQSTDYHHLVLKNFLWIRRLALLNQVVFPAEFDEQIKKALEFSLYVHKPDGTIPSLSDGDTGSFLYLLEQGYQLYGKQELRYAALRGMGGTPPLERSKGFPNSGYYILRSGWGEGAEPFEDERHLVFDCGPLGEGNHGHFDLLSFEMAAYGQSLIVDPGRYTYHESGEKNWRVHFRKTAAHNTVLVDGKNQTRYTFDKTRFKVKGPQPDFELKTFVTHPAFDFLHGIARSHEYPVIHERKIFFVCSEYWIVTDRLTAQEPHSYDLLFHLSHIAQEQVSVDQHGHSILVTSPHLLLGHLGEVEAHASVEAGFVSQIYGVKQSAPIIKFSREAATTVFHTVMVPFKTMVPSLSMEEQPVYIDEHITSKEAASAISIVLKNGKHTMHDSYFIKHETSDATYRFGSTTTQDTVCFMRHDEQGKILRKHTL